MARPYYLALGLTLSAVQAAGPVDPMAATNECLVCHNNESFAIREPSGSVRSLYVEPRRFFDSVHAAKGCDACHAGFGTGPHNHVALGDLPPEWQPVLANRPDRERSAIAACMNCHPKESKAYLGSIHGEVAAKGSTDVPLCNDCHGNHYIHPRDDLESQVNPGNVPATCAKCHANALVMARYDVRTNVVQTFEASFHGQKSLLGEQRAAVCVSCHGVHDIRSPADPLSRVYSGNLVTTCGQCHMGASDRFVRSFKHTVPDSATAPLVYWVSRFYVVMIYLTIGMMLGYVALDFRRRRQVGVGR